MTTPDPSGPSTQLLELLACPRCRGSLEASTDKRLDCIACGATYPVRGGVAILLVEAGNPATATA